MSIQKIEIIPVTGLPEFKSNDDLVEILSNTLSNPVMENDILVITQKIISKIENRTVNLQDKDFSEVLKDEATQIIRKRGETIIARTKHGFICANAGIDKSNIEQGYALLLPEDPDKTAYKIRKQLFSRNSINVAVIISDTFGRAWRKGQTNVAIGCSGIEPSSKTVNVKVVFTDADLACLFNCEARVCPAILLVVTPSGIIKLIIAFQSSPAFKSKFHLVAAIFLS